MDIEKRQYPRVAMDESVQIVNADGGALPAVAVDVSLLGMQLLCDAATVQRITDCLTESGDETLHIRLPLTADESGINAYCRVVYLRHLPEDECRVGLQYTRFSDASYDRLECLIDQRVSYPEERVLSVASH